MMTEPIFRLTVEQYHAMIEAGVIGDDDPVELLEGALVFKMGKNPAHRICMAKLQRTLPASLPPGFSAQFQDPITLEDGEPEPDAAVIRGVAEDYRGGHPGPADVALVIEVSDRTLARDRGIKLRSYARAGIAAYWIIDLEGRAVEAYGEPDPSAAEPAYGRREVFDAAGAVPLTIGGAACGTIRVADLLP